MPISLDHQRIVEEIQNALAYDAVMPESTVDGLAADYSVACDEANQRLRECADLLRRGLRGEAIQRCEIEPNLLDVVASLDFPERTVWCDSLRQTGRAVPPALLMDAAAELNAAYAVDQPLTALMKRHRLLALARAPLRDRIDVVRQIAAADPANALWADDLRVYERQRHKQLQAEIDAAARTGDVSCLATLERELRESVWTEAPPAPLLERAAGQATRLRSQQARAEMLQLEPELNAAFSDFDVERARHLRGRWNACKLLAALPNADRLNEMVAPALDWLDEQDRRDQANAEHAQALADLERGLDEGLNRHDLDRVYHRLVGCERGVPEVLERRFHERMAELALAESRRNKLWFAAVGAGAIVTAASILLFIGHQAREQEVAEAVKSLQALLEQSKVAEAEKYFEMLGREKHWLSERPEIAEQHARLDGMVKAEADRRAAFASAISGAKAAGVDRPDRALLDEARRLATTSGEKGEVLKFERLVATRQREVQDEKNRAFNARVEEIRLQMEELDSTYIDDVQEKLQATTRLEREAADLVLGNAGGAEAELVSNARALHTRLQALVETANLQVDQLRYLQEITASVGDRPRFRTRLAEYVKRFPGSKRSADFQRVIDGGASIDDKVERWNALAAEFSALDLHKMTPELANTRLTEAAALVKEWPNDPQVPMIGAKLAALEPIARRLAGGARIDAPLKEIFHLPTMTGLKMVKMKDQKNYYIEGDLKPESKVARVHYLKDFKLSKGFVTVQQADIEAVVEAPQAILGREIDKELQRLDDPHWEAVFCRIMDMVTASKDIDPILKAQLLLQVLTVARTGSLVLDHAFAKHFQLLSDSAPDGTMNWLDPADRRAAKARRGAEQLLASLPDIHAARDAAVAEYKAVNNGWESMRYEWVGWLQQAADGSWRCASAPLAEELSAELVLLSQTGQPPVVQITRVGRISTGHAAIDADEKTLHEGQPVYAALPHNSLKRKGG